MLQQPILLRTKKQKMKKKKIAPVKNEIQFPQWLKGKSQRGGFSVAVKIFSAIFAKPSIYIYIFLYVRLRAMTTRRRKMRNTEHEMLQFVTNKVKPIYTTNSTSSDGGSGQRVGSLSRRQLDKKARGGVNSNLHSRVHVYTIYNVTCTLLGDKLRMS